MEAERIKEFRTRVIRIQSIARGYVARKHYQKIRKSTIKAQSYVRTWLARKEYLRMYDAIVVLQNCNFQFLFKNLLIQINFSSENNYN